MQPHPLALRYTVLVSRATPRETNTAYRVPVQDPVKRDVMQPYDLRVNTTEMAKTDFEVLSPGKNSQMTHRPLHKRDGGETGSRKGCESENGHSTSTNQRQTPEPQSRSQPPEAVSSHSWGSASSGVVLLAVFVGSLVFMAAIFYQFPELDE